MKGISEFAPKNVVFACHCVLAIFGGPKRLSHDAVGKKRSKKKTIQDLLRRLEGYSWMMMLPSSNPPLPSSRPCLHPATLRFLRHRIWEIFSCASTPDAQFFFACCTLWFLVSLNEDGQILLLWAAKLMLQSVFFRPWPSERSLFFFAGSNLAGHRSLCNTPNKSNIAFICFLGWETVLRALFAGRGKTNDSHKVKSLLERIKRAERP